MEASQSDDPSLNPVRNRNPNPDPAPNPLSTIISSAQVWPTIDGPLGLTEEASVDYARRFYKFGFALLPWLWFVNCFYFWPVLRHARAFPQIRNYVVRSAIGFSVFTALLSAWALTFSIGGEQLFGPVYDKLVMYNVADRLGLSGLA
ncbi:probable gamma-secretase subunit PEN-2 [Capsella rubella]|nr:probable gamma-secretase subunit PEN-2 [Capsella rubella]